MVLLLAVSCLFFSFFIDTATTDIYTLSLHDALPIFRHGALLYMALTYVSNAQLTREVGVQRRGVVVFGIARAEQQREDRKSTRLNSSHRCISYAVFCLKKKNNKYTTHNRTLTRDTIP